MNASDALIKTLVNNGLEVVFANPGTSEMHLVAAIDHNPAVRPVLGLFEGVGAVPQMDMQECQENQLPTFFILDLD